jgi:hypothetical protein
MVENHVEVVADNLDLVRSEGLRVPKLKEPLKPVAKVALLHCRVWVGVNFNGVIFGSSQQRYNSPLKPCGRCHPGLVGSGP